MTSGAHFLLVGDSTDLSTLQTTIDRLPLNAYGQIFIEVASATQIRQWDVPERMSLSWLCRDSASSTLGAVAPRGELVARAVDAWVAEWIPEQHGERRTPYIMWIGCSASERVTRLYCDLARFADRIHLHHPHHD